MAGPADGRHSLPGQVAVPRSTHLVNFPQNVVVKAALQICMFGYASESYCDYGKKLHCQSERTYTV